MVSDLEEAMEEFVQAIDESLLPDIRAAHTEAKRHRDDLQQRASTRKLWGHVAELLRKSQV